MCVWDLYFDSIDYSLHCTVCRDQHLLDVRDTGQIVAAGVRLLTNGHLNSVCKCEIRMLVCKYPYIGPSVMMFVDKSPNFTPRY